MGIFDRILRRVVKLPLWCRREGDTLCFRLEDARMALDLWEMGGIEAADAALAHLKAQYPYFTVFHVE